MVVAACLVSTGSVYAYVQTKVRSINVIAAPHLTPTGPLAKGSSGGLSPENILLIGNQTRVGIGTNIYGSPTELSGSLSDVIMILHLNPSKQSASILSIPRDVFIPEPAGSPVGPYQKIDAALNDGPKGPDNLVQAITADFGIPINHYLEVNFLGFQRTVDALGGIQMNFADPVYDSFSGLDIRQTGCQHLNGFDALALVRARHLQYLPPGRNLAYHASWPYDPSSDLSRIVRDHAFVKELTSVALSKGLTNPLKANSFLDSITRQITVDPGFRDQVVSLAGHYRHLNPAAAPTTTLPVNQVGGTSGYAYAGAAVGDVVFANQPLDNQAIRAWDPDALPAPATPTGVQIQNVTDIANLGSQTAAGLRAAGLPVTTVTDGPIKATTSPTWVDYPIGGLAQALGVMSHLQGAVMLRPDPGLATGVINVEIGSSSGVTRNTARTIDPAPSASSDTVKPWDPQPC